MVRTQTHIIHLVILKIKQEISVSWILRDKNENRFSHAAMFGCWYPMVSSSALHQWKIPDNTHHKDLQQINIKNDCHKPAIK